MVEEEGEIDSIITKEDIEREKRKLQELKTIAAEKRSLVKGATGKGTRASLKEEAREASAEAKKQRKLVSDMKKRLRALEKKQREQDTKIKSFFSKASGLVTDPKTAIEDLVGTFLNSSRAVPILGSALGFAIAVYKIIEREFGDGGIFDLRVKVKDIVRSIVGLKNLVDIDAGVIFMSPDTRLTTMPPETSNTESLRDGHVRYNQLSLGWV